MKHWEKNSSRKIGSLKTLPGSVGVRVSPGTLLTFERLPIMALPTHDFLHGAHHFLPKNMFHLFNCYYRALPQAVKLHGDRSFCLIYCYIVSAWCHVSYTVCLQYLVNERMSWFYSELWNENGKYVLHSILSSWTQLFSKHPFSQWRKHFQVRHSQNL